MFLVQWLVLLLMTTSTCRAWCLPCIREVGRSTRYRGAGTSLQSQATEEQSSVWFPTRIQDSVDYSRVVTSAYVRHVVVETREMADIVLQTYTSDSNSEDPFGDLAQTTSVCPHTRLDGGRVGWIERHNSNHPIFPSDVVTQLWKQRPKSGDVFVLGSDSTNQFHVVRIEQVSVLYRPQERQGESLKVGSFGGQNALIPRSKLKGQGVTPTMPNLLEQENDRRTYTIITAGCQMNMADTERLAGVLEQELNMAVAPNPKQADVVVLNTCSIRDHAEQKVYDALGPYAARKRNKNEKLALIVTGCVAQQEGEALLKRVPEVDVVLGPQYVPHLKNVLESVEWGHQVVATAPILHQEDFTKPIRGHKVKAWVNVIYGCNEHCTYCVVPAVRGMESSRSMESILQECLDLASHRYKEVTLLGQNIDAYGRDMTPKRTFADLLHFLNSNLPEGMRIRYVTSHPRYFSHRVIDAVANLDKVCECFHMPFQAGDNEVLQNMRRGYTFESYMRIIDRIRKVAPDASICGDVIVGFPGETDEAFERTLDLMKRVKFDNLNTFAYSPRPNTEAALWENQVAEVIKAERLQRVQELAAEHGMEKSQRYVGRIEEVLVEDGNPRNPKQVMGRTRQGRQVFFDGSLEELEGKLVDVRITEARTWSLMGELVSNV